MHFKPDNATYCDYWGCLMWKQGWHMLWAQRLQPFLVSTGFPVAVFTPRSRQTTQTLFLPENTTRLCFPTTSLAIYVSIMREQATDCLREEKLPISLFRTSSLNFFKPFTLALVMSGFTLCQRMWALTKLKFTSANMTYRHHLRPVRPTV